MIWATVSSWPCFCWLYTASPSLAEKNITNLISVLSIWWHPCVESSLVLLEEGVCYDQCVLLTKLYCPLPCFILYSKAKFAYYSRCFLTSYFWHSSPLWWKGHLFRVLLLESLVGLHGIIQFQLLQHYWLGHRLGLLWYYWMVCLGNKQRSFCQFWDCTQSTAFQTLLLTMMVTPFLPMDSFPQWWSSELICPFQSILVHRKQPTFSSQING